MSEPFKLRERISEVEATSYRIYQLRLNPFPMSGVAPEHPKVFAARDYAYTRISDFIVRTFKSKKWSGTVVIADYGNGKTHTLKLIRDTINEELGTTSSGSCLAIFIENLGDNLTEFHQILLREIGISDFIELLWNIVNKEIIQKLQDDAYLKRFIPEQPQLFQPDNVRPYFSSLSTLRRAVSSRYLSKDALFSEARSILQEIISNQNLLKCCISLLIEADDELVDTSWRYISGRSLTLAESRKLGLSKSSITDEEIAQEIFSNIMNIFRANSYSNVYLLIDEIEDLIPLTKLKKRSLLGGLRRIIDNNQINLMMIIGTTMPGWVDLQRSSPPLAERFSIVVDLPPLTPNQTYELIERYLSSARLDIKEDGISPFSKSLVDDIWKQSEGNVRKILELCYSALEKGVTRKVLSLDSSLLKI